MLEYVALKRRHVSRLQKQKSRVVVLSSKGHYLQVGSMAGHMYAHVDHCSRASRKAVIWTGRTAAFRALFYVAEQKRGIRAAAQRAPMDFEDLHFRERKYSGMRSYAQSKTANVLFTLELAKRWGCPLFLCTSSLLRCGCC